MVTTRATSSMFLRVALLATLVCCDGGRPGSRARAADLASFDHVWTTIRDQHFDPTLGGLDWNAVRAELRPKVIAARDRDEVRGILRELLGRLRQTHFAILASGADRQRRGPIGLVGLDVRPLDGGMVVTTVEADGPAADAGVGLGWRVDTIAGQAVADLLAPVRAAHAGSSRLAAEEVGETIGALAGPLHEELEVGFDDGRGHAVVAHLGRTELRGIVEGIGHAPATLLVYQSRWVGPDGAVLHLRFNEFADPVNVMAWFRAEIAKARRARGLVIDLRGNPGGISGMATGMAGWLVRDVAVLGTTRTRDRESRYVVNPQPAPYLGPLAILVDELSMSTSEIFAAVLQDLGRARVFGRRTPGAALPSRFERLPNGDRFQYAVATYVSSGGRTIEGHGVVPDEVVALDRADLLAGTDAPLDAALRWIAASHLQEDAP